MFSSTRVFFQHSGSIQDIYRSFCAVIFFGSSLFLLPHSPDSVTPVNAKHPDSDEDANNDDARATMTIPYREEVGKYTGRNYKLSNR